MFNKTSSLDDPTVLMLVIIMAILLLVIAMLAHLLTGAAAYYYDKQKEEEKKKTSAAAFMPALVMVTGTAFYLIVSVIAIELLVIFVLLYQLRVFLSKEKAATGVAAEAVAEKKPPRWKLAWEKMNSLHPVAQEAQMDLGHDYDGIRELDNRLPPWWLYGFYATIVFAVVYLWQHHVSHTAPLSGDEYRMAVAKAEAQKAEYLKNAANNVDENTVKIMTAPADIADGKSVFERNCTPCHGVGAQGIVGPNLTDDYWLHGGSVSDIFKTIKYGWPEKGMKSWKDDLSPVQIAETVGYIKSLHGSNPPNAKEKQGELYHESASASPAAGADAGKTKMAVTGGQ